MGHIGTSKNRGKGARTTKAAGRTGSPMFAMALEPRFMFDAAGAATAAETAHHDDAAAPTADAGAHKTTDANDALVKAAAETAPPAAAPAPAAAAAAPVSEPVELRPASPDLNEGRKEVVFVESNVPDLQTLVNDTRAGVEVVLLDASKDGLAQIAQWAETHSGYDSIHVVSHGAEGEVFLGTLTLDQTTAAARSADLATVGRALTADGDLLLYGCYVGNGGRGTALLDTVAALTGADVAGSVDATGDAAQGGNWALEKTVGTVTADAAVTRASESWAHLLTLPDGLQDVLNSTTTGPFANGFTYTLGGSGETTKLSTSPSGIYLQSSNSTTDHTGTFTISADNTNVASFDLTAITFVKYNTVADFTFTITGHKLDSSTVTTTFSTTNGSTAYTTGDYTQFTGITSFDVTILSTSGSNTNISQNTLDSFTIANAVAPSSNHAPTVDLNGATAGTTNAVTWTEAGYSVTGSGPVAIATSDATIADQDGDNLSAMTVTVSNAKTGDALSLSGTYGSIGVSGNGTSTLTLSGNDTAANYQAALRAITYSNSTDNPDTTARTINVTVTDVNASPKTSTAVATTVTVVASNDQPGTISDSDATANSVPENSAANTTVGVTASATDPDGDTLTWTLTDDAGGRFQIDSSTGVVSVKSGAVLDYESATSHTITAQAADPSGVTRTQTFTINVSDVNEAPTNISLASSTITQSAATAGASIGALSSTDPDAGQSFTYTLVSGTGSANNTSFDVSTGTLKVGATPLTAGTYSVRVRTTDNGSPSQYYEKQFSITVTDNVPPVVQSIAPTGSPAANASTVTFRVTFDAVANNVSADDFQLTTTGTAAGSIGTPTTTDNIVWDVPVTGISGAGTLRLDLKGSTNITDAAGNGNNTNGYAAAFSSGTAQTVDRVAPTFDAANSSPADNATLVLASATPVLKFSEAVQKGASGNFTLYNVTDSTVIETFAYNSSKITGWGTSQLTITPTSALPSGKNIAIQWDATAVTDTAGNALAGNATNTTYNFTTNTTPTIGGTATNQAVNDTTTVSPFSALTVTDPDTQGMDATVTITNGANRGDFTGASATGWTRTVSGSDYVYTRSFSSGSNIGSTVQAAIRALVFQPRSNAIAPSTTETTSFSVSVNDGTG
ncbi:DUF4347 domain-containing protein, partial [Azospirillum sp. sgz302134]